MNFNLYAEAVCDVVIIKTGEKIVLREEFELFSVPPDIAHEILSSYNPVQAYFDWIAKWGKSCNEELARKHISLLRETFGRLENRGYTIKMYGW